MEGGEDGFPQRIRSKGRFSPGYAVSGTGGGLCGGMMANVLGEFHCSCALNRIRAFLCTCALEQKPKMEDF